MKTVLVTGSKGQLGNCIRDHEHTVKGYRFIYVDYDELDITDPVKVTQFFRAHDIEYCINCAAYTAVDKAEQEIDLAKAVNEKGTQNLAKSCIDQDACLIHISTDFVFDGERPVPYHEEDQTNPLSVYGITKLNGEKLATQVARHFVIRTSWLYSEYNQNFLKTMLRLGDQRDELNVVYDQVGTPTYAGDLAKVIMQILIDESQAYGVYHYSNEGVASWYDFAKAIFQEANISIDLKPIPTSAYPTPAKRPSFSVLDKSKLKQVFGIQIPYWRDSLKKAIVRLNTDMRDELMIAMRAAIVAGTEILKIYNKDFSVEYKDDKSPLTEADKKSNEIIISYLKNTVIPIISEENKEVPYEERKEWNRCWVVDPLDGTKEFIKKNGEFTVNIALVEDGKPKLGVIYVPVTNELYYADVNSGKAFKSSINKEDFDQINFFDESDRLATTHEDNSFIRVVGSRSHMNQDTLDYVNSLKDEYEQIDIVSKGSSLKFCLVAEGRADVYPRYAPTMEWDTAAGQAICEATGLKVLDIETNKPMVYNRENMLNNYFLVTR